MTLFLLRVLTELNRLLIQLLQTALKHLRVMRLQAMRSKTSSPNSLGQELVQSLISQGLRSSRTSSGKAASGTEFRQPMRADSAAFLDRVGQSISQATRQQHHTMNANAAST